MHDLIEILESAGALRRGHFVLSSGRHSQDYVQCALLLEEPARARSIGQRLAGELNDISIDSVIAPALGGVIIGFEVATALQVPFRFTERQDGEMCLRRGFTLSPGERVVVIEDVVTTGKSTRETVKVVEHHGGLVVGVGSIIDRTGEASVFGVPFRSLLSLALQAYAPMDCPLCQQGRPVESPGSRRS